MFFWNRTKDYYYYYLVILLFYQKNNFVGDSFIYLYKDLINNNNLQQIILVEFKGGASNEKNWCGC